MSFYSSAEFSGVLQFRKIRGLYNLYSVNFLSLAKKKTPLPPSYLYTKFVMKRGMFSGNFVRLIDAILLYCITYITRKK